MAALKSEIVDNWNSRRMVNAIEEFYGEYLPGKDILRDKDTRVNMLLNFVKDQS